MSAHDHVPGSTHGPSRARVALALSAAVAAVPVASMSAAVCASIVIDVVRARLEPTTLAGRALVAGWLFGAGALVAGLVVVPLAGWPAARWLARRGRTGARDFAVAGGTLGAAPCATWLCGAGLVDLYRAASRGSLTTGLPSALASVPTAMLWTMLCAWCGMAAALAFWWYAERSTEDRP